jgi:hypothetical protein
MAAISTGVYGLLKEALGGGLCARQPSALRSERSKSANIDGPSAGRSNESPCLSHSSNRRTGGVPCRSCDNADRGLGGARTYAFPGPSAAADNRRRRKEAPMDDRSMTPDQIDQALVPVDPSTLPRDDPRKDERRSVTPDGIAEGPADLLARHLLEHQITCHVQTISPRVTVGGDTHAHMTLYEVCVRQKDLKRATELAQAKFPESDDRSMTPDQIDQALVPVDPSKLPREDPRQDERWSVTLDGIAEGSADLLAQHLLEHQIPCHVQTISPRVTWLGFTYLGMTGLYEVCVRREDLKRATELARVQFPEKYEGEWLQHGRIWGPSKLGEEPVVLCQLPYEECWDLAGALVRVGVPAIVLPDDVSDPTPPEDMSFKEATTDAGHILIDKAASYTFSEYHPDRLIGQPEREYIPVEERAYCVVVEDPRLKEAATIAEHLYGDAFHLDGSAYDG